MMKLTGTASIELFCPHCWQVSNLYEDEDACSECRKRIPIEYRDSPRELRPLAIQAMGWSGHGKSSYLAAMAYAINRGSLLWRDFTCAYGTDSARKFLIAANQHVESGELPGPTAAKDCESYSFLLRGMGVWGDRLLTFRDSGGEVFEGMEIAEKQERFVLAAPVILMFISLDNLRRGNGRTADMLMTSLTDTLRRHKALGTGRSVVVVITKGDLLRRNLPREIRGYIKRDELWRRLRPGSYRPGAEFPNDGILEHHQVQMTRIDKLLRDWLKRHAPFHNIILDAARAGLQLRFSIVSSTGEKPPKNDRVFQPWQASRVLDPLLWAVQMEKANRGVENAICWKSPVPADSLPPVRYSLILRNTSSGAEQPINVGNQFGDLGEVAPSLKNVSFALEDEGVRFSFAGTEALDYGSGGVIRRLNEQTILLKPGEHLVWRDWYIEPSLGYFH